MGSSKGGLFVLPLPSARVRGLNRCAASMFGVFGISPGAVSSRTFQRSGGVWPAGNSKR